MNAERLLAHFERIADAPDAVDRLRRFILDLAVRGKLVPQDEDDEPASALVKAIAAEKSRLTKEGAIRKERALPPVGSDEAPFALPRSWQWVRIRAVTSDRGQMVPTHDFTYIDVTAINKATGSIEEPRLTSAAEAPSRARKIVRKGDVIYSCVRPYLLNVAVLDRDLSPTPIASTAFAVLNGFGLVEARYLWVTLRSPALVDRVEAKMRGQAYPAINDADFALLPFPLPPLLEQRRIVSKIDELMAMCDRLEAARAERDAKRERLTMASLARLNMPEPDPARFADDAHFALDILSTLTAHREQIQRLRQTILDLAVRGKLVPQDRRDVPVSESLPVLIGQKAIAGLDNVTTFPLPDQWMWAHVADVFEVAGGIQKTPQRTPRQNAFPYLGVANVYRGRLDLTNVKKFELGPGELQRKRLEPGDIVIIEGNGSLNEIGRCAKWNGEIENCVHQNHVIRCRPCDTAISDFVLLFLNSPHGTDIMRRLAITSSGLYSLSVGKIRKIEIPLPPLSEQHRIVAKVDELMALCDRLEASSSNAETTRSRLLDALLAEALRPLAARDLQVTQ